MSDRSQDQGMRRLVEEIAHAYKRELPTFALVDLPATEDLIEPLITAFLAEREGEARDREASLQMSVSTNLASQRSEEENAALQAQLHRALGELGQLRGALETLGREPCDACGGGGEHSAACVVGRALSASPLSERAGAVIGASAEETDAEREREACIKAGGIATRELDWGRLPLASDARRDAVDALRDELAKGGGDA